ncbi:MAG TPA: hypothetical protein VKB86_00980 [Pyrinomonadaceae bacterium]|nr:hypothetical protein [Pyrinomonadaceae bacterium]
MQNLSLHETASKAASTDLEQEIKSLEAHLVKRRSELVALQTELREFKSRYTQVVGSRMAELAEVERAIKEAEARLFNLKVEDEREAVESDDSHDAQHQTSTSGKTALRKLFWSVARLFHPDHASDQKEAERRHAVMAEASRAYQEGDIDSLHTLLEDEQLQFFCTSKDANETEEDLTSRLLMLKGELLTVEYGIKRIKQDGLYHLKLKVEEEAKYGRDHLSVMAKNIDRQIRKARRRLEHFAG